MAIDLNNNIIWWNHQCEQVTGYYAAEVINNSQVWMQLYPDTIYRENLFRVAQYMSKNYPEHNRWNWKLTCKDGKQKAITWSLINRVEIPGLLAVGIGEGVIEPRESQPFQDQQQEHFHKALQEHAIHLRFIIENLPVMVGALDEQVNIVFWNHYCEQVTGYNAEEIVNNPHAWELLYPDQEARQKVLQIWQKVIQTHRELHRFTMLLTCKGGTQKKIMWSMLSDKIKIQGWAIWGVGIDMTVHQKIIQNHEDKLKKLLESLPLMVMVYDEQKQLIGWNKHCEKITGYHAFELLHNLPVLTQLYRYPQHRQRLQEKTWPKEEVTQPYQTELTCKDGTVKIIAWSNYSEQFPLPDWGHWLIGEEVMVIKNGHQLPSNTHDSILYTAFNNIDIAICITDDVAQLVYTNQAFCRLYGMHSDALMNRQFTTLVPKDSRNLLIRNYFSFLNGNSGNFLSTTQEALHADGYTFKIKTHIYRAVQNSQQAYVVWIIS